MKSFCKKSAIFFIWIFIVLCIGTFIIEICEKGDINSTKQIAINVVDGKVPVPEPSRPAIANYTFTNFFLVIKTILYFLVPILFLVFGGARMFIDKKDSIRNIIKVFLLYSIFEFIMYAPLDYFSGFYRTHLLDMTSKSFKSFVISNVQDFILSLMISIVIFSIIYVIYKHSKYMCISLTIFIVCISIIGSYLSPIIVEPLYNDFNEITNESLKNKINDLTEKAGIGKIEVMSVDKSKSTNSLNAYMTGLGASRKIVLWDNTINTLSEEEILCVTAHEIGHYKYHHIIIGIILEGIETLIILSFAWFIIKSINKNSGKDNNLRSDKNIVCFALIIIVIQFFFAPVENYVSRKMENQADTFAVQITEDKINNAKLQAKLMETNLGVPDCNGFINAWYNDHPTTRKRIEMFNNYVVK